MDRNAGARFTNFKKTLRGFVKQIRIFIEHEIFYIPEEVSSETSP
jgi:hypothetical protein